MIDREPSHSTESRPWLVLWTESRAEKQVERRLGALGMTPWLPLVRERRKWSDRWKEVEVPLFPGYLFAQPAGPDWQQLLRTPGVLTVVKENGKPAMLSDSFVRSLRTAIERDGGGEVVHDFHDYAMGDQVVVQEGALAGFTGVVRERKSARQLILWIAEVGRGVALTIGTAMVRRVQGA